MRVCALNIQCNLSSLVPPETQIQTIEATFQEFTERKDIAILLINQHVC